MKQAVVMRKTEEGYLYGSSVSGLALVCWMSILILRHSIIRATLPTLDLTIASSFSGGCPRYRPCVTLYVLYI